MIRLVWHETAALYFCQMLSVFTSFLEVFAGFRMFCRVLPVCLPGLQSFAGCYQTLSFLQDFIGFYHILPVSRVFTGSSSFSWFYGCCWFLECFFDILFDQKTMPNSSPCFFNQLEWFFICKMMFNILMVKVSIIHISYHMRLIYFDRIL